MRLLLFVALLAGMGLVSGCKKDGGGAGAPISEEASAEGLFLKINGLYVGTLKPALTKSPQTYTDATLAGSDGGQAVVNGSYKTTSYSGSSGSTSSATLDVTIVFQHFKANGVTLDGKLRFYDGYSYRQDCGSSGCASSTHTSVDYYSKDGSGNVFDPFAVVFDYNGTSYSDQVLLYASKVYSSFAVKLTNAAGKIFSFSY